MSNGQFLDIGVQIMKELAEVPRAVDGGGAGSNGRVGATASRSVRQCVFLWIATTAVHRVSIGTAASAKTAERTGTTCEKAAVSCSWRQMLLSNFGVVHVDLRRPLLLPPDAN